MTRSGDSPQLIAYLSIWRVPSSHTHQRRSQEAAGPTGVDPHPGDVEENVLRPHTDAAMSCPSRLPQRGTEKSPQTLSPLHPWVSPHPGPALQDKTLAPQPGAPVLCHPDPAWSPRQLLSSGISRHCHSPPGASQGTEYSPTRKEPCLAEERHGDRSLQSTLGEAEGASGAPQRPGWTPALPQTAV